jgi:hypothetical protein
MLRSRRDLPGPVLPQPRRAGVGDFGGAFHCLVSAALFVGAKFGADNTPPKRWTGLRYQLGLRDLQEMIPEQQVCYSIHHLQMHLIPYVPFLLAKSDNLLCFASCIYIFSQTCEICSN